MSHRVETVPLALLVSRFDPENPKDHDLPDIKASIRRHGWVELPVIDERTGRFGAGHGRVEALLEMHQAKERPPRRIEVAPDGDWLVPVLRDGHESSDDLDAKAYLVGSNHLTEKGGWVERSLADILTELVAADRLEGTGYTPPDLDALLASFPSTEEEQSPAPDQSAKLITRRSVLVDVADDASQRALIDRLTKENYKCRALNS